MTEETVNEDAMPENQTVSDQQQANASTMLFSEKLEAFRRKLLDLSGRNRLLNHRPGARTIQIVDELPDQIFEQLMANKAFTFRALTERAKKTQSQEDFSLPPASQSEETIVLDKALPTAPLIPQDRPRKHSDSQLQTTLGMAELDKRLNQMRLDANREIQETGGSSLFLAIGFLEWYDQTSDDTKDHSKPRLAPLLLVPVTLSRIYRQSKSSYHYKVSYNGDDLQRNESLAEKLIIDHGTVLPELDSEDKPELYFQKVADAVARQKQWLVKREAVLGFFNFQKLLMYRDLNPEHWIGNSPENVAAATPEAGTPEAGTPEANRLVMDLFEGQGLDPYEDISDQEYAIDQDTEYRHLPLPLDADSSQHSAIIDAAQGKSFVLQGPPGTGKSQTITNLIAWAIGHGKTILFVAEKQAALQVVEDRLDEIKLDHFCLQLHSQKSKPSEVFAQINSRLEATFRNRHNRDQKLEAQDAHRLAIENYLNAINIDVGPNGESLDQVFWKVAALRDAQSDQPGHVQNIEASQHPDLTTYEACQQFFEELARYYEEVEPVQQHPWAWIKPLKYFSQDENAIRAILDAFISVASQLEALQATLALATPEKQPAESKHHANQWPSMVEVSQTESIGDVFTDELKEACRLPDDFVSAFAAQGCLQSEDELARIVLSVKELSRLRNQPGLWRLTDKSTEAKQALEYAQNALKMLETNETIKLLKGFDRPEIARLSKLLRSAVQELSRAQRLGITLSEAGYGQVTTLDNLEQALAKYRHFHDPIIQDRSRLTSSHFSIHARENYQKAKAAYQTLVNRREKLNTYFDLSDINSAELEKLSKLQQHLKLFLGKWTRHFSGEYKRLKREAQLRLKRPQDYKLDEKLDQQFRDLIEYMKDHIAFQTDKTFLERLGDDFAGHKTDWQQFDALLTWSDQAMSYRYGFDDVMKMLAAMDQPNPDEPLPSTDEIENCIARIRDCLNADAVQTLQLHDAHVWSMPFQSFLSQLHAALGAINQFLDDLDFLPTLNSDELDDIEANLATLLAVSEFRQAINEEPHWADMLGTAFQADKTDYQALEATLSWMNQIKSLQVPEHIHHWLLADDTENRLEKLFEAINTLDQLQVAWCKAMQDLKNHTADPEEPCVIPITKPEASEASQYNYTPTGYFKMLKDALGDLLSWANYARALERGKQLGLNNWLEAIWKKAYTPEDALTGFQLSVFEAIASDALEKDQRLAKFSRQALENHREQFVTLDKQLQKINQAILAHDASLREPPMGITKGRVGELTEMGIVQNEVKKQKRHIRIRQLFERAAEAVQSLTPCIMMSPLSVSRYLPTDVKFDLVVMDEASQIKTEDGLGALLRGRQAVIVGDPKQLPPTDFFNTLNEDEEDDNLDDDSIADHTESILEAASKAMRHARLLRWHYRSRHEKLIAFSNEHFYGNRLIIFPSPTTEGGSLGIVHHEIPEGYYKKSVNDAEAEAIANAVMTHIQQRPRETLGVVAFNAKQMERIQYWIDKKKETNPELRTAVDTWEARDVEPLFVKNLENVQGDERDVIFISYTFGPDKESGKVYQRFGPIGRDEGWRRLNVLITRAKKRIEIFASIKPSEIACEFTGEKPGIEAMRNYLQYARTGGQLIEVAAQKERDKPSTILGSNTFEEAIAGFVRELGFEVESHVGVADFRIDLAVKSREAGQENEYRLGILCDGESYREAKSARDRDRLREAVMINRGWNIHRVWSMDWYQNQPVEKKRLKEVLLNL